MPSRFPSPARPFSVSSKLLRVAEAHVPQRVSRFPLAQQQPKPLIAKSSTKRREPVRCSAPARTARCCCCRCCCQSPCLSPQPARLVARPAPSQCHIPQPLRLSVALPCHVQPRLRPPHRTKRLRSASSASLQRHSLRAIRKTSVATRLNFTAEPLARALYCCCSRARTARSLTHSSARTDARTATARPAHRCEPLASAPSLAASTLSRNRTQQLREDFRRHTSLSSHPSHSSLSLSPQF